MIPIFLSASLLAAPLPAKSKDVPYPVEALRLNKSAGAAVELIVDPTGKVTSCKMLQIFGDEGLAGRFCAIMQRSRWTPAIDHAGQPSQARVRTIYRMFVPDTEQGDMISRMSRTPDLEVTVKGLAAPLVDLKLSVEVDPAGRIVGCEPRPASPVSASLQSRMCGLMLGQTTDPYDPGDGPRSFVTELTVRMTAAKSP